MFRFKVVAAWARVRMAELARGGGQIQVMLRR